jgi:hypothetical protein
MPIIILTMFILLFPTLAFAHGNPVAVLSFGSTVAIYCVSIIIVIVYRLGKIVYMQRVKAMIPLLIGITLFLYLLNIPYDKWYPFIDISEISIAIISMVMAILVLRKSV